MILLTNSQIIYLNTIFNTPNATITELAAKLNFSKPSIVNACSTLSNLGLINYSKNEISLTEEGKKYASNYEYRKKTIELFLKDILKINEKQASIDAGKLMQDISCQTTEALDNYLSKILNRQRTECICNICIDKSKTNTEC